MSQRSQEQVQGSNSENKHGCLKGGKRAVKVRAAGVWMTGDGCEEPLSAGAPTLGFLSEFLSGGGR